ncbi:MAG: hypothetical protein E6167_09740, partial [Varibaculum cambriense]|nr:hypothetical protein [Varibaculum cambriense]
MRSDRPSKKYSAGNSPRDNRSRKRRENRSQQQEWRPQTDRVRTLVFQVLLAVETKDAYANLLLPPRL